VSDGLVEVFLAVIFITLSCIHIIIGIRNISTRNISNVVVAAAENK